MKRRFTAPLFGAIAMLSVAATTQTATAATATKIIFPKGSYCASY